MHSSRIFGAVVAMGATDTTQATVTLVAAAIGGVAAVVAAILGVVNASRARAWTGREQWWIRFTWACEKALSRETDEVDLGLQVLKTLVKGPWANAGDNEMAVALGAVLLEQQTSCEVRGGAEDDGE